MPEFDPENLVRTKETFQGSLVKLRDLYSNRIPTEVLHSNNPDARFKVRKGWFIVLSHSIKFYTDRRDTVLNPTIQDEYEAFRADISKNLRVLTTAEEIDRANKLINSILGIPANTGVPYDKVITATNHALENSSGKAILRWHGLSQDEIAFRLPNYQYSHTYDIWLQQAGYVPPSPHHEGWVIAGYNSAYQGEGVVASQSEKKIQDEVKTKTVEWQTGNAKSKRLLILAQTLPNPHIFTDPSFPWQNGLFQQPPYPVWTVAFDGQSQIALTKHNLEGTHSEKRWAAEGTLRF